MLNKSCYRRPFGVVATTAAVVLFGAALNVWSAEAPAPVGNTAPAEIPEPSSDVPATRKARKLKSSSGPPAATTAESARKPPEPAATQGQTRPGPSVPAPATTSTGEPKPVAEPAAAKAPGVQEADVQPPFVKNAAKDWYVSLSFDDYWFNAPITEGSGGTQTGNLYGGTLSLAPPSWRGKTFFDCSFRQGSLHGSALYPLPLSSSFQTFVNELFVGFHFETLPWMHDGKERGHVISYVGVSWDGWSTTETLNSGVKWPATGLPDLTTELNMVMANVGLGYDLVLWNPTSKWFSYRLGVRAEAIGAVGGSNYNVQQGEQLNSLALYGLARGTAYMELTLRDGLGVFVEGGYQHNWWFFSESPAERPGVNEFQGYWGGFGRAGLAFHF